MPPDSFGNRLVYLAPALPSEKALSMDLYHNDLRTALEEVAPDLRVESLAPLWKEKPGKLARQAARYGFYPLSCLSRGFKEGSLFHVLDHSSGHLCHFCRPAIVTCHDLADWKASALTRSQLEAWKWRVRGLKKAARIIAISQNTASDVAEILQIDPRRISINPYGINPAFRVLRQLGQSRQIPELHALPHSTLLILHVGSNAQRKNLPTLLKGLRNINANGPVATLVKVGETLFEEFGGLIDELGIRSQILELGSRTQEELIGIYNDCDIFCFPSSYEGFGRPVLEAQACGLPCVLAKASSLPEVGGKAAHFHETFDSEQLAQLVLELAASPDLRWRTRELGLENASRFSWRQHAEKVLEVYQETWTGPRADPFLKLLSVRGREKVRR